MHKCPRLPERALRRSGVVQVWSRFTGSGSIVCSNGEVAVVNASNLVGGQHLTPRARVEFEGKYEQTCLHAYNVSGPGGSDP